MRRISPAEQELEDPLIEAHAFNSEIKKIRDRYEASLTEDARARETLRANGGIRRG